MLREYLQLKNENAELTKKLQVFEKCDPEKVEEYKLKRK